MIPDLELIYGDEKLNIEKGTKLKINQQKILIVDDEVTIRLLLHQKLTQQGFHCEEVCCSDDALEKLKTYSADLVMLDMKMPGKSGMDLLPELKAYYPDTAVVMATAVAEANLAIQCMRLGADDYITKPFNLDEVGMNVENVLEKQMLERQIKEYENRFLVDETVQACRNLRPREALELVRKARLRLPGEERLLSLEALLAERFRQQSVDERRADYLAKARESLEKK